MQYERNDEITYDEGFSTPTEREYYTGQFESDDYDREPLSNNYRTGKKNRDRNKSFPMVLLFQIIICVLCGLFLYFSKLYAPEFYSVVMDKVNSLVNDSLVVDGNDVNDYFVAD